MRPLIRRQKNMKQTSPYLIPIFYQRILGKYIRLTVWITCKGNPSLKLKRVLKIILNKNIIHTTRDIQDTTIFPSTDTLKQQLAVQSSLFRRYKASKNRRDQNHKFFFNERSFYLSSRCLFRNQRTDE